MRLIAPLLLAALALTGCGTPPPVTGADAEKLQAEAQQRADDAERQHQKQQTKTPDQKVDEAERQHQRGTRWLPPGGTDRDATG
jgi:outer membrane PBP1 activator LpoA protein